MALSGFSGTSAFLGARAGARVYRVVVMRPTLKPACQVQPSALPLPSQVTLGKLSKLSVPSVFTCRED